ncbi:MAG: ABC transporter substrate-binding protein [Magnetospirillum sp.]|jgi:branched-chain amino acid transport system substrate-binding protein|nr:ABC transporter substrate-binding protein [Magnetospirillum sp.]
MNRGKLFMGAMLVAGGVLLHNPTGAAEVGVTDNEILIGALGVLTGPLYHNGKTIYDGVESVYNEVNAAGGIHGRKLRYVREDDACRPDQAVAAAKKLIHQHNVFMIHGGGCSNASLAAMPDIVAAKIPWVITASTAPQLTDPVNPMIFTTMLAGWMETEGQLQRAIDLGAKKIAIVRQRDAWADSRYAPLLESLKTRNITAVADEDLSPDPSDATAVALRLRASGADAVIAVLFPKAATILMRDMYKIGYRPIVVGGSAISDMRAMEQSIGVRGAMDKFEALAPTKLPDDPSVANWKEVVKKHYPSDTFMTWHLFGVASAEFVVAALRKAGRDLTRESIAKAMSDLTVESQAYAGPISCKPSNHQCYRSMAWFSLRGGDVIQVGTTNLK